MTTPLQFAATKRPALITVLVVLTVIGGILNIVTGIMAFSLAGPMLAGVVFVVLGLIYLAVAKGLADGNATARIVVAVVAVIQLVTAIVALTALRDSNPPSSTLGSGIWTAIMLAVLYSPKANAFFTSRAR